MASQDQPFKDDSDNKGGQRRRRKKNGPKPLMEGVKNGSYDDTQPPGAYQARGGRGGGRGYPNTDPGQYGGPPPATGGRQPLLPTPGTNPQQNQPRQGPVNPDRKQKKNKTHAKNDKQQKQQSKDSQPQQQKEKNEQPIKGQKGNQSGDRNSKDGQAGKIATQGARTKSISEDSEDKVDIRILLEMEKQKVFRLKKKSIKFPRAKFFCRLCEYHLDRVQDYRKHVSESRHMRRKEVTDAENTLRFMPAPTDRQTQALDEALEKIYASHGLTDEGMEQRKKVVQNMEEYVHQTIPGVCLQMYGSSLTGFGLKSSDINIDLYAADVPSLPKLLTDVFNLLRADETNYVNVHSDFSAKVPAIVFTEPETSLECKVTINSRPATATSQLLSVYSGLDPRVRQLSVAFRYWAKVCRLDQQCEGTLPAYATSLLSVFFLQHLTAPVLPVLTQNLPRNIEAQKNTEWLDNVKEEAKSWTSDNSSSIGSLWLEMLRYFSLGFDTAKYVVSLRQQKLLARAEKKWNSKKLAIEDPFSQKRNVARTVSNTKIYEYFQDSLRKAYHYFGLPRSSAGDSLISQTILDTIVEKSRKTLGDLTPDSDDDTAPETVRDSSLEPDHEASALTSGGEGESSPERQMSDTFQSTSVNESSSSASVLCEDDSSIISIGVGQKPSKGKSSSEADVSNFMRSLTLGNGQSTAKSKTSETKVAADDSVVDSGACRPEGSDTNPDSVVNDKKETETEQDSENDVHQFARDFAVKVVQSAVMQVVNQCASSESVLSDSTGVSSSSSELLASSSQSPIGPVTVSSALRETVLDSEKPKAEELSSCSIDESTSAISQNSKTEKDDVEKVDVPEREITHLIQSEEAADEKCELSAVELLLKDLHLEDKDCFYEFSEKILTDGKGPAIICGYCEKEGHLKTACPEDQLPKLIALPKLNKNFIKLLCITVEQVPRDFGPTHYELKTRDQIVWEVQDFIRQPYPGASLRLFGSSCNGFGFRMSDLDICMTFESKQSAKDINCAEIVERLAKKLKEHKGLYQVVAIPTAKVPIVKFRHRQSQLEGDISLYNTLAQHNTKLLSTYSEIDHRVKALGYAFKVFAKVCDIGDASRGSLSSYAYVLMLLHYLQQCKPPVIPVLQELYPGKEKPEVPVDDCNAYFFDNLKELPKMWNEYGKNKLTVGELWLGLFRYYTEEFNYKELVVCIRQKAPLTRFEKLWNGHCLAIEDPFDLNHNLGAGLSRKMNNYILKAFIHGRKVYGTPVEDGWIRSIYRSLGDYFFDRSLLTEGTPPNDRGCRVCGKIGHIAKECPVVLGRKEREERERKQREDRHRMNRAQDHHNSMSPSGHHSKSHSSPNTPSGGHMPPNFREKPHRSKSVPEEGAIVQMSPRPDYRQIPMVQQQMYVPSHKSSPLPIPLIGGNPISPVGKGRADVPVSPRQVSSQGMMPQGSASPMSNYIPIPLSQMLNVAQSPPSSGQHMMMLSPQKHPQGMGHQVQHGMGHHSQHPPPMRQGGGYPYSQSLPTSQMHSPPQHVYPQSHMPTSPRQVTQQGGNFNITVSNDMYKNYNHPHN